MATAECDSWQPDECVDGSGWNGVAAVGAARSVTIQSARKAFSHLEAVLRKADERTVSGLWSLIGSWLISSSLKNAPTTSPHADMTQTEGESSLVRAVGWTGSID